jgi:hypothetical protein
MTVKSSLITQLSPFPQYLNRKVTLLSWFSLILNFKLCFIINTVYNTVFDKFFLTSGYG